MKVLEASKVIALLERFKSMLPKRTPFGLSRPLRQMTRENIDQVIARLQVCSFEVDTPVDRSELEKDDGPEISYIKEHLPRTEILCQLAEEAAELSQAALKLRRAIDGTNSTIVTEKQGMEALLEEYGDVLNSIEVLLTPNECERAIIARLRKRSRWVERLKKTIAERTDT